MNKGILIILLAVISATGIIAWQTLANNEPLRPTHEELLANLLPLTIESAGVPIDLFVEVANSGPERARGLMGRTHLAERSGMLFVFDGASRKNFWMKNTLIPLDILWIDSTKTIVGHATMVPCHPEHENDPCPMTTSPPNTLYALEVHDQFVEEHAITIGDRVLFSLE